MSDIVREYGDVFTVEIEGLDQLQRDLNSLADNIRLRTAMEMLDAAGEAVVGWIRENIALTFWRNPTGNLSDSVDYETNETAEGAECLIGPDTVYARIHEFGGDIYPGERGYLRFQVDGHWVTISNPPGPSGTDHVHIPPRPYVEPAISYHTEELLETMQEVLYAAIANDAGTI